MNINNNEKNLIQNNIFKKLTTEKGWNFLSIELV